MASPVSELAILFTGLGWLLDGNLAFGTDFGDFEALFSFLTVGRNFNGVSAGGQLVYIEGFSELFGVTADYLAVVSGAAAVSDQYNGFAVGVFVNVDVDLTAVGSENTGSECCCFFALFILCERIECEGGSEYHCHCDCFN